MNFNLKSLLISLAIIIPTLIPLANNTFFPLHDFTHVARLVEMNEALNDGHFPVRWSKHLGYGFGLPQFSFYAPLFYYLAQVFHVLGFSALTSIKLTLVATAWLGSYAALKLGKKLWGNGGGLLTAILFTYAPYRAVDLYVRGAFGELLAISFIMLSLWALTQIIYSKKQKWVVLAALSLSGILLSHNLTAFLSYPLIALYFIAAVILQKKNLKANLIKGLAAALLGIGLACFYWLPALAEKNYTRVDDLTQGFSYYAHHFLYLRQFINSPWDYGGSIFGPEDDISFEIGKIHIALISISSLLFILTKKWRQKLAFSFIVMGLLTSIAVLLTTFKTKFIWDALPFLAYIQFPWRFLTIITAFTSLMAAAITLFLSKSKKAKLLIPFIAGLSIIFYLQYQKPKEYLRDPTIIYYQAPQTITQKMSGIIPDFMPKYEAILPLEPSYIRYEAEGGDLEVLIDHTHEFLVRVQGANSFTVNIAYFPGWELYIDGTPIDPNINPQVGAMSLDLSGHPETVLISGKFTETPVRQAANVISLISVLTLASLAITIPERKHA